MKPWIKDLLVAFAGTTLSIILTFGTSALIDHVNRNKDRRLTALMVLSSIESSVRELEESGKIMALIGIPEEEVMAFTDERTLDTDDDAVNEAFFRGEFSIPAISLDSLTTMKPYNDLLDSLRRP